MIPLLCRAPCKAVAAEPYQFKVKTASLRDVEALWNSPEQGVRLVFQP